MELYVRKNGRARIVIVPNVMMHFLKMPLVSAGLKVERDDRGAEQVGAGRGERAENLEVRKQSG